MKNSQFGPRRTCGGLRAKALECLSTTLVVSGIACGGYAQATPTQKGAAPQHTTTASKKITTAQGWSYEILIPAPTGAKTPQKGQTVSVHYTGWFDEKGQPGKQFDSSVTRGNKFQFRLGMGQVIKGWELAVQDMKMGEKRRVYLPAALAYGSRGAGNIIGPDKDLIFDIELFSAQ